MTAAEQAIYERLKAAGGKRAVPLEELARVAGCGQTKAREALKELKRQGLIWPAVRQGKTLLWKTVETEAPANAKNLTAPVGLAGASAPKAGRDLLSQPTAGESGGQQPADAGPLGGDRVAADRRASAADPDLPVPSPEEKQRWLAYADEFLDKLASLPPADLPAGACDQCGKTSRRRWHLGKFELCRDCRRSRRRVQLLLELTDNQRKTLADALTAAAKARS